MMNPGDVFTQGLPHVRASGLVGDTPRTVSLRYFNFYRFLLACVLIIFGALFGFGTSEPHLYFWLVLSYGVVALAFLWLTPDDVSRFTTLLAWQVALDILVLTCLMFLSGQQRTTIPYLLMTTLAGAALVGEGRMVLGFAAMATIAVLSEQAAHVFLSGWQIADISRTGLTCLGYFAVAIVARLLARRALMNEALARQRGEDLQRQLHINALIIEELQDGVLVLDEEGILRQYNPRAVLFIGHKVSVGMSLADLVPSLEDARLATEAQWVNPRNGRNFGLRVVQTDSEDYCVLYLEDLARIEAQAQQIKLAALGRLTANIAHEIRNPLAAVSQAAELLMDEKRAAMQQRLSKMVLDNAARINRIVRDVLELGRRDRGSPEWLNPVTFIEEIAEEFRLHTPVAKVALSVVLDTPFMVAPEAVPQLFFDRVHLAQIIGNLLGNALRYCRGLPGSVRLELHALASGDSELLIVVVDDGPGIALADRDKVFEPFHTTDPKGTGLGLYVARELAEANGGRLVLTAAQGPHDGARFHLIGRGRV